LATGLLFFRTPSSLPDGAAFVAVFSVFFGVLPDGRVLVTAFSAFSIFSRFWLGWGVRQPISGSSRLSRDAGVLVVVFTEFRFSGRLPGAVCRDGAAFTDLIYSRPPPAGRVERRVRPVSRGPGERTRLDALSRGALYPARPPPRPELATVSILPAVEPPGRLWAMIAEPRTWLPGRCSFWWSVLAQESE
jgi:hypothetical protein